MSPLGQGGAPLVGARFADRYRVERLLGRGAMSAVYAVYDEQVGERVALKALVQRGMSSPTALERFRREVHLAQRVTHPNVARIFDLGEHDGVYYLTMQLVQGADLREYLRRCGPLSTAEAVELARQVCEGLASAHAAGVLHRDLKPTNVLIDERDHAVITDFGVALPVDEDEGAQTPGLVGTPRYMAPEQMLGGPLDARADLYAFGHLLYEMLRGTPIDRQWRKRPSDLPSAVKADLEGAGVLPEIADLTGQLLNYAPAARPASAQQVLRVLTRVEASTEQMTEPARLSSPAAAELRSAPSTLAVLPFRSSGTADAAQLALLVGEELVDVLARTRGLNVLASRATARLAGYEDPIRAGAELRADYVIAGELSCGPSARLAAEAPGLGGGDLLSVTIRLIDVCAEIQLFSERFEGHVEDVLDLQHRIARRVAETLRVEIALASSPAGVSAEAVRAYLLGRSYLKDPTGSGRASGIQALDRALELEPRFARAVAAHAIASVRTWLDAGETATPWERLAGESVARAREIASEHAETHLAAGMYDVQRGEYRQAALELAHALAIAPTYAAGHECLGLLECEAGRADRGARRIQFAISLDPDLTRGRVALARYFVLCGETERGRDLLAELELRSGRAHLVALSVRMRLAAWRGDLGAVEACRRLIPGQASPAMVALNAFGQFLSGALSRDAYRELHDQTCGAISNPRLRTAVCQLAAEAFGVRAAPEESLAMVQRAADSVLADVQWADRCPVLRPTRELSGWQQLRDRVYARAESIWS